MSPTSLQAASGSVRSQRLVEPVEGFLVEQRADLLLAVVSGSFDRGEVEHFLGAFQRVLQVACETADRVVLRPGHERGKADPVRHRGQLVVFGAATGRRTSLRRMYYPKIMHSDDPPGPSICHHGDVMRSAIPYNSMIYPHPRSPPARGSRQTGGNPG